MKLLRAILTVGGFTGLSRVLGFVRDILIAAVLGAGAGADAFFVAFKLPNLFRRLFAEGAFAAAFVPILAGHAESGDESAARDFTERALSLLVVILVLAVTAAELAMPAVMLVFAPGFADNADKFALTVLLARITFPYLLFISVASLLSGVLNTQGRFAAAAATPIWLNLCLIGAVLVLAPHTPSPAHALAAGVFAAGVVQAVFLYAACARVGVAPRLRRPRITADIKLLFKRILPVAAGAGVYQINLVIDTVIASLLASGSITYLFFADRVVQLPLGVVGVAVGTALLPALSRAVKAGDGESAHHYQNRALEFTLLLTLPAAAALVVIAEPVVHVLFERGAWTAAASAKTSAALAVYALGLPAYVLIKALAPGFFARGDTATPVKIALAAMAVNLILNLALMGPFQHVGIAAATVVSSWLNAGLMALALRRRGALAADSRLRSRLPRAALAAALMTLALWAAEGVLSDALAAPDEWTRALALAALVITGLGVFTGAAFALGAVRRDDLNTLRRARSAP
ncbi:MAG: murein biosynthesis integral membrane protein MurJ [Rhodospirillales bacterium]